jgi:hypothetical protein
MLVLNGIPRQLNRDHLKRRIEKTVDRIGGTFSTEIFVPSADDDSAKSVGQNNSGFAVVEFRVGRKIDDAKKLLESIEEFHHHGELDHSEQVALSLKF